jgi:O-antigen/teichoic acid export membrane protein
MKKFLTSFSQIKFVRDIATMQIGQIVTTGSGFLASILFARLLGLHGYGVYAIVLAFTGLLGFITNLGQQTTALTFFAEAFGKKDNVRMKEVLHYYLFLSGISALLMAILIPVLPWITNSMYGDPEIGKLARIIFVSAIIDPLFVFGSIVLQSVREIRKLTILENARLVSQLGLSILFLLQGKGVEGVLLGNLFGTALMSIISLMMYKNIQHQYNLPRIRDILFPSSLKHIWKLGKSGAWIAVDKNFGNMYPTIFIFLLSTVTTAPVVGLVRLAFKLGNLPASFVLSSVGKMASSVIPTLSSLPPEKFWHTCRRLGLHTLGIHGAATIGAIIVVPPLIPIVYGEAFSVATYPFIIIALLHTGYALHALITPVLRLYSKVYISTAHHIIALTASVILFFVFSTILPPTRALYISLIPYHFIIGLMLIPTIRLLLLHRRVDKSV